MKILNFQEENHISEEFTRRIMREGGGGLSQEEMDRLLREHAVSMQALRKKQELEKQKFKELLELKKRERLLKRRGQQHGDDDGHVSNASKPRKPSDYFVIDFSNNSVVNGKDKKNSGSGVQSSAASGSDSRPKPGQSGWFYIDLDTVTGKSGVKKGSDKNAGQKMSASGQTRQAGATSSKGIMTTSDRNSVSVSTECQQQASTSQTEEFEGEEDLEVSFTILLSLFLLVPGYAIVPYMYL